MQKKYFNAFLIILAGILSGLSVGYMNYWLIWIALIPFFSALPEQSLKTSVFYGLLFGIVKGSILLFWIVEGAARFSGTETSIGIPIFAISILYYALYPMLFTSIYSIVLKRSKHLPVILPIILVSFLWVSIEWLRMNVLLGLPWIKATIAFSQLKNLYGIQLASITGQWGISFIIVLVNLFFTIALKKKSRSYYSYGFTGILAFYLVGFFIYFIADVNGENKIKVAIIQENIKAETRWDKSNGDALANIFFDLNIQAAKQNPDVIIWSETALPWTFRDDDGLVRRVLEITKKSKADHLLGILSESENVPDKVFNSAYYIQADGAVISRYDKVNLLSFIEQPLMGENTKIPFLSEGLYSNIINGETYKPLVTKHGKLGVLLCNESLTPYESRKIVSNGAEILINMSNDAWVENSYMTEQHFFLARLRAVESGKDMLTNSNRGYGGHISGNGNITAQNISPTSVCIIASAALRQKTTFYYKMGDWFIYIGLVFMVIVIINIYKTKNI